MKLCCCILPLIALISAADWGYLNNNGPSTWKNNYPVCNDSSQSPINIVTADTVHDAQLGEFTFDGYDTLPAGAQYKLENNGHAVENKLSATVSKAYSVSRGGLPSTYHAAQFHFHWGSDESKGSEHTVDGKPYPMEMHIVHYSSMYDSTTEAADKNDGLAVLGFFFKIGGHNNAFDEIVKHLENITTSGDEVEVKSFPMKFLFPSDLRSYWRYKGSLTTPACYETVIWTVFQSPIEISSAQLAKFRTVNFNSNPLVIMQNNFRPTQPLNGRTVLTSINSSGTKLHAEVAILSTVILYFIHRLQCYV